MEKYSIHFGDDVDVTLLFTAYFFCDGRTVAVRGSSSVTKTFVMASHPEPTPLSAQDEAASVISPDPSTKVINPINNTTLNTRHATSL